MPRHSSHLKIKTLFTPTAFVCLLALSSQALPVPASIPSSEQTPDTITYGSPFRRVSRPITIHVDLESSPSSPSSASSSTLALLIEQTEKREQIFRQFEQRNQEEFARLQQEQDELEKVEQDRDQLLDNEEEEQLDQDPETVRRRQEESLGLWMTDAEFEALGGRSQQDQDDLESREVEDEAEILLNTGNRFDLYAEDFQEVTDRELPTEEEMLMWPIINLSQFEDRQDEVQDEYDDQL